MNALVVRPVRVEPSTMLALHAAHPERYCAFFESAASGTSLGRFDILFAFPQEALTLHTDGTLRGPFAAQGSNNFLTGLDRWWGALRESSATNCELPFRGGWLVYLGYELAAQIESRLKLHKPKRDVIASAVRIPAAVVREHGTGQAWIVAETQFAPLVDDIVRDIASVSEPEFLTGSLLAGSIREDPPECFLGAVKSALDYIARGDIYQANLSRAWCGRLIAGVRPHDVYRRLRRTNPGPFCALMAFDDWAIVSSSPERLVRIDDGWISTRPIAGTRPRGGTAEADRALIAELRAHPKERAEHVMLIDLERNDLGRVCEAGTVEVDEYMTIETYAHVHHIVSNVRGRLRSGIGPGRALGAVFPGGTITGCPKVRCMEVIAELEDTARGAYTGSLGYVNRDGSMDFNILIRSVELQDGEFELRAGAGIVADSVPERELEESRAKARGVLRAFD
ncbi:MAG TPA: aminodeoxychorismate synthase component I [Steroidobacteraceae bacterium]